MKLYSYFRSSAAYRVRIALNLKGLDYSYLPVSLTSGEQKSDSYLALNPQGLVPAMMLENDNVVAQSIALLEWLEETHPTPALLPKEPLQRARVRSMVNSIACDIHPLCNTSVVGFLRENYSANEQDILQWYTTWMHRGFIAIEQVLAQNNTLYSFSNQPCMADACLVPQVYNARRFDIPLEDFTHLTRVVDTCMAQTEFIAAAPEAQPDFPIS